MSIKSSSVIIFYFLSIIVGNVSFCLAQNGNFAGNTPPVTTNTKPSSSSPYNCPTSCKPLDCVCASKDIPGGLSKEQTPQFVTLTFDDAIQTYSFDTWRSWLNSTKNQNGCPITATFFVSTAWSDFSLIQKTFNEGNEIGAHTINHPDLVNVSTTVAANEMKSCVDAITTFGGVPRKSMQGFRHPFLSFNKGTFDTVFNNGFTYDSSVTLDPKTEAYWPHTLDYGMPYDPQPCVNCPPGIQFTYAGKWMIPMYNLINTKGTLWTSMDPIIAPAIPSSYDEAMENLKASFILHYESKLPFGLYQHAAQLVAWGEDDRIKKIKLLSDFVEWTLSTYKDTWYVTNQQLINWIKKPVATDKMLSRFPCYAPGVDPSNTEICDGVDNNGDGTIDNGLQQLCQFNDSSFYSCFGCPATVPNITNPITISNGNNRQRIPDAGCPNAETWDPLGGKCVNLKRPTPKARSSTSTTSSAESLTPFEFGFTVVLNLLLSIFMII